MGIVEALHYIIRLWILNDVHYTRVDRVGSISKEITNSTVSRNESDRRNSTDYSKVLMEYTQKISIEQAPIHLL